MEEKKEVMPLINSKQTQSDDAVSIGQIHSNQVLFFPDGIFTSLKSTCWFTSGSYFLRVSFLRFCLYSFQSTLLACFQYRSTQSQLNLEAEIKFSFFLPLLLSTKIKAHFLFSVLYLSFPSEPRYFNFPQLIVFIIVTW